MLKHVAGILPPPILAGMMATCSKGAGKVVDLLSENSAAAMIILGHMVQLLPGSSNCMRAAIDCIEVLLNKGVAGTVWRLLRGDVGTLEAAVELLGRACEDKPELQRQVVRRGAYKQLSVVARLGQPAAALAAEQAMAVLQGVGCRRMMRTVKRLGAGSAEEYLTARTTCGGCGAVRHDLRVRVRQLPAGVVLWGKVPGAGVGAGACAGVCGPVCRCIVSKWSFVTVWPVTASVPKWPMTVGSPMHQPVPRPSPQTHAQTQTQTTFLYPPPALHHTHPHPSAAICPPCIGTRSAQRARLNRTTHA